MACAILLAACKGKNRKDVNEILPIANSSNNYEYLDSITGGRMGTYHFSDAEIDSISTQVRELNIRNCFDFIQ